MPDKLSIADDMLMEGPDDKADVVNRPRRKMRVLDDESDE